MADRQNIVGLIKDFLFPKFCAGCGQEGTWLCASCLPEINTLKSTANAGQAEKAVANLDGITALFDYGENTLSKLIKMFKYNYLTEIADIFAKIINNTKFNDTWQGFVIIPVPLHARRERERGFNQAEILAKLFAKKLGLKVETNLSRTIYTVQQAKLSREERQLNLKDAFIWSASDKGVLSRNSGTSLIAGEKVLLVDDVFTTGATMQECAKVLKNNGVKIVWGLVLARG